MATSLTWPKRPIRLPVNVITSIKWLMHALLIGILCYPFYLAVIDQFGADPVQALLDYTGVSAINILLVCLSISPVAKYCKFAQCMQFRRPLGLYSAAYATSHVAVFIAFELGFEWRLIISEIIERPYITVGFIAFMILLVLSITSSSRIKRKLGKSWFTLHRGVYFALLLAILHFFWAQKSGWLEPLIYLALGLILLSFRVIRR